MARGSAKNPTDLKVNVNGSSHVWLLVKWSTPKGINFNYILAELCFLCSTPHVQSLVERR